MIRSAVRPIFASAGICIAGPALAHGTLAESADFYAGALHPFLAWEHLILLIGLGLLLGRPPGPVGIGPAVVLVEGVLAGLVAGLFLKDGAIPGGAAIAILIAGLVAGGVLAAGLALPRGALAGFTWVAGVLVGFDTDVAIPVAGGFLDMWIPFLGLAVGALLIVINMMALSSLARVAPWTIGVRIAGSWIAASAFLVLAVTLTRAPVPA